MVEPTSWKWRERFYTSARMFFSPSTTLFRFSVSHTTFTLSILSSPLIIRTKNSNSPHSIFVLLGQFRWLPQIGMVPQPLSLSCSLSLPLSAVAFGSTHLVRSWIWFVFVFILLFLLVVFFLKSNHSFYRCWLWVLDLWVCWLWVDLWICWFWVWDIYWFMGRRLCWRRRRVQILANLSFWKKVKQCYQKDVSVLVQLPIDATILWLYCDYKLSKLSLML